MGTMQQEYGAGFLLENADPDQILTPEDMDDEQRMMMRAIREFGEKDVAPVMDRVEKRDFEVVKPLFQKAAELGIFMAEVPEQYGGLGLSVLGIAGMMESRNYLGSLASTVFAHQGIGCLPLINFGTQAQIDKYLQSCMNGTRMAAFALTEPSSGSDAMNIRTTAVLNETGTHYIVNGAKQFITNAGWADLFILFAKVDGKQFTAFLLDRDTPGLTVGPNENLLGIRGSSVCPMNLDNSPIPVGNLLGEIGKGHKVAMCTLNLGRLKMATNSVGGAKRVLACATKYAAERMQFGGPIADFGVIQAKLADMGARLYASESTAYRTAGLVYHAVEAMGDEGRRSIDLKLGALSEFAIECALAKVHCSEMVNYLADEAIQVHGGYGFSEEFAPAKMFRDWRIARIYEGTSEVCRMSSMKHLFKKATSGDLELGAAVDQLRSGAANGTPSAESLESLRAAVVTLKRVFVHLYGLLQERFGEATLLDKAHQQYVASLADIAIEVYAAESTILRVLKLQARQPGADTALPEALARLYFERAAGRIRQEATEVLAALYEGDALREALQRVEAWLPLPVGRMDRRQFVARKLVESGGALPEYRNG